MTNDSPYQVSSTDLRPEAHDVVIGLTKTVNDVSRAALNLRQWQYFGEKDGFAVDTCPPRETVNNRPAVPERITGAVRGRIHTAVGLPRGTRPAPSELPLRGAAQDRGLHRHEIRTPAQHSRQPTRFDRCAAASTPAACQAAGKSEKINRRLAESGLHPTNKFL